MSIPIYEIADITINATGPIPPALNFGTLIGHHTHAIGSGRVHGPYDSLTALSAVFSAETEIMAWGTAVFGVDNPIREVYVGRIDSGDASLTASLTAIHAAYPGSYFQTIESRAEADINEAATYFNTLEQPKIFLAQTADAAVLAGTAGNVALDRQTAIDSRTAVTYNANSDAGDGDEAQHGYREAALASQVGRWSLDRYSPGWEFQTLVGQVPDTFTVTQFAAMKAANVNVYAPIDGFNDGANGTQTVPYTWPGLMASGRAIHAQCSIDWLKRRTQEAFVRYKAAEASQGRRIAIDNASLTAIDALTSGIIERGYNAGHLTRDLPTVVTIPRVSEISSADYAAGIVPFTIAGYLRKSAQQFAIGFNVQT